jgi:hypothetical protein
MRPEETTVEAAPLDFVLVVADTAGRETVEEVAAFVLEACTSVLILYVIIL